MNHQQKHNVVVNFLGAFEELMRHIRLDTIEGIVQHFKHLDINTENALSKNLRDALSYILKESRITVRSVEQRAN